MREEVDVGTLLYLATELRLIARDIEDKEPDPMKWSSSATALHRVCEMSADVITKCVRADDVEDISIRRG